MNQQHVRNTTTNSTIRIQFRVRIRLALAMIAKSAFFMDGGHSAAGVLTIGMVVD
jgi:hypothetical protein